MTLLFDAWGGGGHWCWCWWVPGWLGWWMGEYGILYAVSAGVWVLAFVGHHSVRQYGRTVYRPFTCQMGIQQPLMSSHNFYLTQDGTCYRFYMPVWQGSLWPWPAARLQPWKGISVPCLLMMGMPTLVVSVLVLRCNVGCWASLLSGWQASTHRSWDQGPCCHSGQWVAGVPVLHDGALPFTLWLSVVLGHRLVCPVASGLVDWRNFVTRAQVLGTWTFPDDSSNHSVKVQIWNNNRYTMDLQIDLEDVWQNWMSMADITWFFCLFVCLLLVVVIVILSNTIKYIKRKENLQIHNVIRNKHSTLNVWSVVAPNLF